MVAQYQLLKNVLVVRHQLDFVSLIIRQYAAKPSWPANYHHGGLLH